MGPSWSVGTPTDVVFDLRLGADVDAINELEAFVTAYVGGYQTPGVAPTHMVWGPALIWRLGLPSFADFYRGSAAYSGVAAGQWLQSAAAAIERQPLHFAGERYSFNDLVAALLPNGLPDGPVSAADLGDALADTSNRRVGWDALLRQVATSEAATAVGDAARPAALALQLVWELESASVGDHAATLTRFRREALLLGAAPAIVPHADQLLDILATWRGRDAEQIRTHLTDLLDPAHWLLDKVPSLAADAPGREVLDRVVAAAINTQLRRDAAQAHFEESAQAAVWAAGLLGFATPGTAATLSSAVGDELDYGASGDQDAALYFAKREVANSVAAPLQLATVATDAARRFGLSRDNELLLTAFTQRRATLISFIPGLDGSPLAAAMASSTDVGEQLGVAADLAVGRQDDLLFSASTGSGGSVWLNEAAQRAEAAAVAGGGIAELAATKRIAELLAVVATQHRAQAALEQVSDRLSGAQVDGDFRPFSGGEVVTDHRQFDDAAATATMASTADRVLLDLYHEASSVGSEVGLVLRVAAELMSPSAVLAEHLQLLGDLDAEQLSVALSSLPWPAANSDAALAEQALLTARSRRLFLRQSIGDYGQALANLAAGEAAFNASVLAPLREALVQRQADVDGLRSQWQNTADGLLAAHEQYAAAAASESSSRDGLEAVDLRLRTARAIDSYARGGYVTQAATSFGPAARLEEAIFRRDQAAALLATLESLYDAEEPAATALAGNQEFQVVAANYRREYESYLWLEGARDALNAGALQQRRLIEEQQQQVADQMGQVVHAPSADSDWLAYFEVADGAVRLSHDQFQLQAVARPDIDAFLESGFDERRQWFVDELLRLAGTNQFEQLLRRWALASQYLQQRLASSCDGEDVCDGLHVDVDGVFGASTGRVDGFTLLQEAERLDTLSLDGLADEMLAESWQQVRTDRHERELFDFYLFLRLTGGFGEHGLDQHAESDALDAALLGASLDRLDLAVGAHRARARGARQTALTFHVLAMATIWAPPLFVIYEGLMLAHLVTALLNDDDAARLDRDRDAAQGHHAHADASAAIRTFGDHLRDGYGLAANELAAMNVQLDLILGDGAGAQDANSIAAAIDAAVLAAGTSLELPTWVREEGLDTAGLVGHFLNAYEAPFGASTADAVATLAGSAAAGRSAAYASLQTLADELHADALAQISTYGAARAGFLALDAAEAAQQAAVAQAELERAASHAFRSPAFSDVELLQTLYGPGSGAGVRTAGITPSLLEALGSTATGPIANLALEQLLAEQVGGTRQLHRRWAFGVRAVEQARWEQEGAELLRRRHEWETTLGLILTSGRVAWAEVEADLDEALVAWRRGFHTRYIDASAAWDERLYGLLVGKDDWLVQAAAAASVAGRASVFAELGESLDASMQLAGDRGGALPALATATPELSALVAGLLGQELFGSLLADSRFAAAGIGTTNRHLAHASRLSLPADNSSFLARLEAYQEATYAEVEHHLALRTAAAAEQAVTDAALAVAEQVDAANASADESIERPLIRDGFARSGGAFSRRGVVFATVNGPVYDTQSINAYEPFGGVEQLLVTDLDLRQAASQGLSAHGVYAMVDAAIDQMTENLERIFGQREDSARDDNSSLAEAIEAVQARLLAGSADASRHDKLDLYESLRETRGDFFLHVDYAPVLVDQPNPTRPFAQNIDVAGLGEVGRVMSDFIAYQLAEAVGLAELEKPSCDRALWDDRETLFEAPTIRSLADIGVSLVAATLTGGSSLLATALTSAAVNLADDALFEILDVATGTDTGAEAALDFAQRGLGSVASAAIGVGFAGVDLGVAAGSFDHVVGQGFLGVGEQLMQNTAAGMINSFQMVDGALRFDAGILGESVAGNAAGVSYLAGAGSDLTSAGISALTGNDAFLAGFGDQQLRMQQLTSLADLMGGGVQAGIEYLGVGATTLNIGNARMLGQLLGSEQLARGGHGLVELTLSQADGVRLGLGAGGIDASIGTIASALGGLDMVVANARIGLYNAINDFGGEDATVVLRMLRTFGDREQLGTYHAILSGQDTLVLDPDQEQFARTVLDATRGREVRLSTFGSGDDVAAQFAAVVLSHEAYRDGEITPDNAEETARAVAAHTEFAARLASQYGLSVVMENPSLITDVLAYTSTDDVFSTYVAAAYDSSEDFARLISDRRRAETGLTGVEPTRDYVRFWTPVWRFITSPFAPGIRSARKNLGDYDYEDWTLTEALPQNDEFEAALGVTSLGLSAFEANIGRGAVNTVARYLRNVLTPSTRHLRSNPASAPGLINLADSTIWAHTVEGVMRDAFSGAAEHAQNWHRERDRDTTIFAAADAIGLALAIPGQYGDQLTARLNTQFTSRYFALGNLIFNHGITDHDDLSALMIGEVGPLMADPEIGALQYRFVPGYIFRERGVDYRHESTDRGLIRRLQDVDDLNLLIEMNQFGSQAGRGRYVAPNWPDWKMNRYRGLVDLNLESYAELRDRLWLRADRFERLLNQLSGL
jgi:hypothetical protein